ncbi:unnamed protein product [Schistosoma mattheei]|uniref:Uncharacterized protein n=1 Tax=Schistosoma mattheei TaxID=31246 RepID=A0A183NIM9_9TREM|nr:unnamed protein product [Schistosoma mattheei]
MGMIFCRLYLIGSLNGLVNYRFDKTHSLHDLAYSYYCHHPHQVQMQRMVRKSYNTFYVKRYVGLVSDVFRDDDYY